MARIEGPQNSTRAARAKSTLTDRGRFDTMGGMIPRRNRLGEPRGATLAAQAARHVAFAVALSCATGLSAPRHASAERSVDGDEELLPIGETAEEAAFRALFQRKALVTDPPPLAPIRNVAEFEPCTGALIRYPLGVPYNLIKEMAEDVIVHVVVNSANASAAVANFLANGVDTSRVDFIVAANNSIWTRDYGPWFVFDGNGDQVIMDHYYNRPSRPNDNVIPSVLGSLWGIPVVEHDLWHTGGNYMTEGHGLSYSTDLVWNENTSMSQSEIAEFIREYYGVDTYNVLPDISTSGIHHIDTWGKLLDEETVLIKEVAPTHADYPELEANALTVAGLTNKYGRPFRVVRVFCPSISSGVAAYTNSLILNDKVLVPLFSRVPWDSLALETYKQNMPGYEVLGFTYSGWLTDDALHCRVMGIADRYMLRVDHDPIQSAAAGQPVPVSVFVDDRSEAGIDMPATALHWRVAGDSVFSAVPLAAEPQPDWYVAEITGQWAGVEVEYYVAAADLSGRSEAWPRSAPAPGAVHRFAFDGATLVDAPADAGAGSSSAAELSVEPNVLRSGTTARVRFDLPRSGRVRVGVYDVSGREVARIAERVLPAGPHELRWAGRTAGGASLASGVYLIVIDSPSGRVSRRALIVE
ncbi:MAG: agmatine deiminase family protein [bacterium]